MAWWALGLSLENTVITAGIADGLVHIEADELLWKAGGWLDCRSPEAALGSRCHRGLNLAGFRGFGLLDAERTPCRQTTTTTSIATPKAIVPNPAPTVAPNMSITLTMNTTNNANAASTIASARRRVAAIAITATAHGVPPKSWRHALSLDRSVAFYSALFETEPFVKGIFDWLRPSS